MDQKEIQAVLAQIILLYDDDGKIKYEEAMKQLKEIDPIEDLKVSRVLFFKIKRYCGFFCGTNKKNKEKNGEKIDEGWDETYSKKTIEELAKEFKMDTKAMKELLISIDRQDPPETRDAKREKISEEERAFVEEFISNMKKQPTKLTKEEIANRLQEEVRKRFGKERKPTSFYKRLKGFNRGDFKGAKRRKAS